LIRVNSRLDRRTALDFVTVDANLKPALVIQPAESRLSAPFRHFFFATSSMPLAA